MERVEYMSVEERPSEGVKQLTELFDNTDLVRENDEREKENKGEMVAKKRWEKKRWADKKQGKLDKKARATIYVSINFRSDISGTFYFHSVQIY